MNGPPPVLADTEKGMDGTVKHFVINDGERDCDTITDRHGNQTVLTYGQSVTMGDGTGIAVRRLHGDLLDAMIARTKPHITYWPTLRVEDYDRLGSQDN